MKGKNGRFYAPHFDMNHDGKLDISELMIMEEVIIAVIFEVNSFR